MVLSTRTKLKLKLRLMPLARQFTDKMRHNVGSNHVYVIEALAEFKKKFKKIYKQVTKTEAPKGEYKKWTQTITSTTRGSNNAPPSGYTVHYGPHVPASYGPLFSSV